MVSVFEHQDFLSYLRRAGQERLTPRTQEPPSLHRWTAWLGLKSKRTLGMVLAEARPPSEKLVSLLSEKLALGGGEKVYFSLLAAKHRAKLRGEPCEKFDTEIRELFPKPRNSETISDSHYKYMSQWYHLVLRELVTSYRECPSSEQLHLALKKKVSPTDIDAALERMVRLGILARTADGKGYVACAKSLCTTMDVPSQAVRQTHREQLQRAAESLREEPVKDREFLTISLRLPRKRMTQAKKELRRLLFEFEQKFESSEGHSVYQVSAQLFPQTAAAVEESRL